MLVRLMKKEDLQNVSNLFVESTKKLENGMRWKIEFATKYVNMLYKLGKGLCYVVEEGEKIIGVGMAYVLPVVYKDILDFKIVLVHPDYRKKGIGKEIMKKICQIANKKYGIENISMDVHTLSNFPISWFESLGFRTEKYVEKTSSKLNKVVKNLDI